MGLLFRPRRPAMRLAAGAATAGIAYNAGKRHESQAQVSEPAAAAAPAAAAPAPATADPTAELERLAGLHQSGVLTDDEFAAAKAKVLGL